jgi:D-threo-aldose 1-dehydrogenase
VIEQLCARHGIALPAAALQWVARHPAVTQVVVGTGNPARIGQSAELARQAIPAFWAELDRLEQAVPNC